MLVVLYLSQRLDQDLPRQVEQLDHSHLQSLLKKGRNFLSTEPARCDLASGTPCLVGPTAHAFALGTWNDSY